MALLEADVNYKVAKDFTNKVVEEAVGQKVMESLTPAQMVIKIVNDQLVELMGGEAAPLANANRPPCVILMCGLQGSGKTTHSGKLAKMLKKQGIRDSSDVFRTPFYPFQRRQILGSWDKIFDLPEDAQYYQAACWQLKKEWIL